MPNSMLELQGIKKSYFCQPHLANFGPFLLLLWPIEQVFALKFTASQIINN